MPVKRFTGEKYWEHKNQAYKEACFNKFNDELVELKGQYDYFIKRTKV